MSVVGNPLTRKWEKFLQTGYMPTTPVYYNSHQGPIIAIATISSSSRNGTSIPSARSDPRQHYNNFAEYCIAQKGCN